jgi:hypothetical protein
MNEPLSAPIKAPGPSRWIAPVALVLSLLAAAGAVWALLKPAPEPPGLFASNPPAADARVEACKGALLVAEGVALQSRANLGPDPVALDTVAANTRLAMSGGAAYLRDFTPSNTPAELAEPIGQLARQLQEIAQHFFVGQSGSVPEQTERMAAATETTNTLIELCK